jgi:hypothetical protein
MTGKILQRARNIRVGGATKPFALTLIFPDPSSIFGRLKFLSESLGEDGMERDELGGVIVGQ